MKRVLIGAATAAAVLFVTAVPAHAVTTTLTQEHREFEVAMTDCSPTALIGTICRGFGIEGGYDKNQFGSVTKGFEVTGFFLQVTGPDTFNSTTASGGTVVGAGTFTSSTGKTASISFTVLMTCGIQSCPGLEGTVKLTFSLSKRTTSQFGRHSETLEMEQGPCSSKLSSVETQLVNPKGSGTVKVDGHSKSIRAISSNNASLETEVDKLVTKGPQGVCV
jgi:hypothetical protein